MTDPGRNEGQHGLDVVRALHHPRCEAHALAPTQDFIRQARPTLTHQGGEEGERRIAISATRAALAMMTPEQRKTALDRNLDVLVPVRRHIGNVHLVGLVRLRYRARTRATSSWFGPAAWAELVQCFENHVWISGRPGRLSECAASGAGAILGVLLAKAILEPGVFGLA